MLQELQPEGVAGTPRGRGGGAEGENINIWAGRRFCVFCAVEIESGERPFLYPRRSCCGSLETG